MSMESQKSLGIYTAALPKGRPLTNDRWVWRCQSSSCLALTDLASSEEWSALSPELLCKMEPKFLFVGLCLIPHSPTSPTSLLPYHWFVLETLPNTLFSWFLALSSASKNPNPRQSLLVRFSVLAAYSILPDITQQGEGLLASLLKCSFPACKSYGFYKHTN